MKFIQTAGLLVVLTCIGLQTTHAMSLSQYIAKFNANESDRIASAIIDSSKRHHMDPKLMAAVFQLESGFHNEAVSSAGAMGIAQLMPDTAAYLGADASNIESNIEGGVSYLAEMAALHRNKGNYRYNYALASYNAGPAATEHGIPSYTYDYINSVNAIYQGIKADVDSLGNTYIPDTSNERKLRLLERLYELRNERRR